MTREEAIELLRDLDGAIEDNHGRDYDEAFRMAIESLSAEPKWIPCSERLPEEEEKTYWVCTDAEYQCECRWTNINHFWTDLTTDWHWHIMDIPQYTKVIAWMPLPSPYKGGDTE